MLDATYVLPLRWSDTCSTAEMTDYLRWLRERIHVIVVDGSPPHVYDHHAEQWGPLVEHRRPHPDLGFANGKVNGVTTGVREARSEAVVVADDDIRFDEASLARTVRLLDDNDLVVVHSYFDPTPWHALWDEARILLNRAFGVHFPAAVGVTRSMFLAAGGYDGDVLFENLELMRTMRFAGARVVAPLDLLVRHLPPERAAFVSQRVRQAYDDLTLPGRMTLWLALAPAAVAAARRRPAAIGAAALLAMATAEVGRRRGTGGVVYPPLATAFAPLWVAERAVCSWLAVYYRLIEGGVPYRDGVLKRAATPRRELRARVRRRLARPGPAR